MLSPFEKHREILLNGKYSAAGSLQQFVLSLFNSHVKFEAHRLGNYDSTHMGIFVELASSYHKHRQSDPAFMQICLDMWDLRRKWGREHLECLEQHKQISPEAYEGGEQSWYAQMRWLDEYTETCRAKHWID